jgi:hypothetical protein
MRLDRRDGRQTGGGAIDNGSRRGRTALTAFEFFLLALTVAFRLLLQPASSEQLPSTPCPLSCSLLLVHIMLRSSLGIAKGRAPLRLPYGRLLNPALSVPRSSITRRTASTVTSLDSFPGIGEGLHGFTVQEKKHVPELHLTAVRLKHDKTDADYLHVAKDDRNNVFGIGFKTNPPDATGVPHILEHTTLCGSEK